MAGKIVDMETGEIIDSMDRDAIAAALNVPFPAQAILSRKGGGNQDFRYVSTQTVIRRLNEATGNNWSFTIIHGATKFLDGGTRTDRNGREVSEQVMMVVGELTIPGLGTRTGYGVQRLSNPLVNGDDLLKAAAGDALKRAAVSFGVAIDLYGGDLEHNAPTQPDDIPGVRKGVAPDAPARPQRQAPAKSNSAVPASYPRVPGIKNTADLLSYMQENGINVRGGSMGDALKATREYGKEVHGIEDIVLPSDKFDEERKQYKIFPSNIADALGYWFQKEAEKEGADTKEGKADPIQKTPAPAEEEDDWDSVPF